MSSLLCEDGFNRQKTAVTKGSNNKCREQRAFATLIDKKVISEVYRFVEVEPSCAASARTEKLVPTAFKPAMRDTKLEKMKQVVGATPSSRPSWYSRGVEGLSVEHADLALMRWAVQNRKIDAVSSSWLSCFLRSEHLIIVRTCLGERPGRWVLPLLDSPGSAAMVWPLKEWSAPGKASEKYYTLDLEGVGVDDCFFSIVDLDMVESFPFVWRSPLWMAAKYPAVAPDRWACPGVACSVPCTWTRRGQANSWACIWNARGICVVPSCCLLRVGHNVGIDLAPEDHKFRGLSQLRAFMS